MSTFVNQSGKNLIITCGKLCAPRGDLIIGSSAAANATISSYGSQDCCGLSVGQAYAQYGGWDKQIHVHGSRHSHVQATTGATAIKMGIFAHCNWGGGSIGAVGTNSNHVVSMIVNNTHVGCWTTGCLYHVGSVKTPIVHTTTCAITPVLKLTGENTPVICGPGGHFVISTDSNFSMVGATYSTRCFAFNGSCFKQTCELINSNCVQSPVFCVTNCIRVGSTGTGTIKQNASYPTLELCGHGNEMMIGSGGTNLHINYRCAGGGASSTPVNWYWRCGTSTSFSNHYFALVCSCSCLSAPVVCATTCAKAFRGVFGGADHTCEQNESPIRLANNCTIHQYISSCASSWGSWSQWVRYVGACNTWRIGAYDAACQSGIRLWRLGARNQSAGEINYIVAGPQLQSGTSRVALYCPYARDSVTWNGDGNHYPIGAGGIVCGPTCVRGAYFHSTGMVWGSSCVCSPIVCATSSMKAPVICATTEFQSCRYQHHWRTIAPGGDYDKFYPISFTSRGGQHSEDVLEIAQSNVHSPSGSCGAMYLKLGFNTTGWGHINTHYVVYKYSTGGGNTLVSKVRSIDHSTCRVGVWLRGGVTYYYRSREGTIACNITGGTTACCLSYDNSNNAYDVYVQYTSSVEDNNFNVSHNRLLNHHNNTGSSVMITSSNLQRALCCGCYANTIRLGDTTRIENQCVLTPIVKATSGTFYINLNSGILNVPSVYANCIYNSSSTAVLGFSGGYTVACTCLQSPVLCATTAVRGTEICSTNWLRNTTCANGIYNQSTCAHFYSAGANYWHINGTCTATSGGLVFYKAYNGSHGNLTNRRGYVYWDGTANFGLLSCAGNWGIKFEGDTNTCIHRRTFIGTCVCSPIVCGTSCVSSNGLAISPTVCATTKFQGSCLHIDGGNLNSGNDAAVYITATNNNDWGIVVNKNNGSATDYAFDARMGASAGYAYYARFNNTVKFTVRYDCLCHNTMICSPAIKAASYMNSGKFCSGSTYLCNGCAHVSGKICSTTGFYGDGSNLTGVSGGIDGCSFEGAVGNPSGCNYERTTNVRLGTCALATGKGIHSTGIGNRALEYQNCSWYYGSKSANTAIGADAQRCSMGFINTSVGWMALRGSFTTANNCKCYNVGIGACTGYIGLCGNNSVAVGTAASRYLSDCAVSIGAHSDAGDQSVIIGFYAGANDGAPSSDTAVGHRSLYSLGCGCHRIAIGHCAGYAQGQWNHKEKYTIAIGACALACGSHYHDCFNYNIVIGNPHNSCAAGQCLGSCTTGCMILGDGNINNACICASCLTVSYLSKSSGSFRINHPNPSCSSNRALYHSFVESPNEGDNIYRWQVETSDCTSVITLPNYYRYLNKNDMVWVSPYRHFGSAYGEVTADQCCLVICSNSDGCFNVLLVGTRKDEAATENWKGAERDEEPIYHRYG